MPTKQFFNAAKPVVLGATFGLIISIVLDNTGNQALLFPIIAILLFITLRVVLCNLIVLKTLGTIYYLDMENAKQGGKTDLYIDRFIANKKHLLVMSLLVSKWTVESFYGDVIKEIPKENKQG